MFSKCKTLNEANKLRAELLKEAKDDSDIVRINNEFNNVKKLLTSVKANTKQTHLTKIAPTIDIPTVTQYFKIVATDGPANTLTFKHKHSLQYEVVFDG